MIVQQILALKAMGDNQIEVPWRHTNYNNWPPHSKETTCSSYQICHCEADRSRKSTTHEKSANAFLVRAYNTDYTIHQSQGITKYLGLNVAAIRSYLSVDCLRTIAVPCSKSARGSNECQPIAYLDIYCRSPVGEGENEDSQFDTRKHLQSKHSCSRTHWQKGLRITACFICAKL